jgi:hypothetical protein
MDENVDSGVLLFVATARLQKTSDLLARDKSQHKSAVIAPVQSPEISRVSKGLE